MTSAQVPRPVEEVFDFIVEPGLLSSYFTAEASGPLVVGAHVTWTFADGRSETVDVESVETNRRVVFVRNGSRVTISLAPLDGGTQVTIEDEGGEHDWQKMLLGLNARMALGIDLRG